MRGIVVFVSLLVLAVGSSAAAAAPAESCRDLKLAQARSVLGPTAKLAQKEGFGERTCTAKVGAAVAATVRSESANDFDWVVAGLQEEPAYVKQLKQVAIGDKGYSYDRWANVGGTPRFATRVLFFRVGPRMYAVEISARRLLPAAKHLALARHVATNARRG